MKSDDTSLFDDPTTPGYVRDLLHAGRRANTDYDVDRGLARHLAAISGTPAVNWAPATTAAKTWPSWIGFAAMPLAAASVAGLLWVYAAERPEPAASGAGTSTVAGTSSEPSEASDQVPSVNAAPSAVRRTARIDDGDSRSADDARPSASERRRNSSRSNAARGAGNSRATSNSRASGESDVENLAIGSSDAPIDTRSNDGVSKRSASVESSVSSAETRPAPSPSQATSQATSNEARTGEEPEQIAEQARPGTDSAAKPAPVIDESRLEREMQMLAVTQRVLASDPARALRLSEQGEREFAGSMLSAERRQLGLLALVKLGRLDEARRAGRPFLARYPKAPWSERLRRALATGVVE